MPICGMSYLFILKAVCRRTDKKIVAKSAADSYQKRDITLALSGNVTRLENRAFFKNVPLYFKKLCTTACSPQIYPLYNFLIYHAYGFTLWLRPCYDTKRMDANTEKKQVTHKSF